MHPSCNYKIGAVIVLILSLLSITANIGFPEDKHRPYLILYAFDAEGELLAQEMDIISTDTILGRTVYSGQLRGVDIILAESGIGITNASMTAQRLTDKYNPGGIIFSGIAGGIDSTVQIGDIVICDCWITHDFTYHGAEGMIPNGIDTYSPLENKIIEKTEFCIDSVMLEKAHFLENRDIGFDKIGERTPNIIVGGNCVSGNSFIDNRDKRIWLSNTFGAKTVDMESAAVAQIAYANGLPFIIFRSASDLAGGSGSATARTEIKEFFRVAAANSAEVVMEFLECFK